MHRAFVSLTFELREALDSFQQPLAADAAAFRGGYQAQPFEASLRASVANELFAHLGAFRGSAPAMRQNRAALAAAFVARLREGFEFSLQRFRVRVVLAELAIELRLELVSTSSLRAQFSQVFEPVAKPLLHFAPTLLWLGAQLRPRRSFTRRICARRPMNEQAGDERRRSPSGIGRAQRAAHAAPLELRRPQKRATRRALASAHGSDTGPFRVSTSK